MGDNPRKPRSHEQYSCIPPRVLARRTSRFSMARWQMCLLYIQTPRPFYAWSAGCRPAAVRRRHNKSWVVAGHRLATAKKRWTVGRRRLSRISVQRQRGSGLDGRTDGWAGEWRRLGWIMLTGLHTHSNDANSRRSSYLASLPRAAVAMDYCPPGPQPRSHAQHPSALYSHKKTDYAAPRWGQTIDF